MAVLVSRNGAVLLAVSEEGMMTRRHECRDARCAVELVAKLERDQAFAAWWLTAGDPESKDARKPHHHERSYR